MGDKRSEKGWSVPVGVFDGVFQQGVSPSQSQLDTDVVAVVVNGFNADRQILGDFLVGLHGGQQFKYPDLGIGQ